MQNRRRPDNRKREKRKMDIEEWTPRTKLGKQVAAKEIKSIHEIFDKGLAIKEAEIVDTLLPDLEESVIAIGKAGRPFKMVQRMTDSGRRNNFQVIVAVGNKEGFVGLGEGRAKEYGPSLRKAIKEAKRALLRVPRGCGSWQCGCDASHSVPFQIEGKEGSVKVVLKPAPKGIGLAASKTSKEILTLAGFSDIWAKSSGHTSSRTNLAKATFEALRNINQMKAAELSRYYTRRTFAQEVENLRGEEQETSEEEKEAKPEKSTKSTKSHSSQKKELEKAAEKPNEKPNEAPKKEPKSEESKREETKPKEKKEEPKPEEPKKEEVRKEGSKEAPKKEEPKPEEPKAEEQKEPPKKEGSKSEGKKE